MHPDQKPKINKVTMLLMVWTSIFFDVLLLITSLIALIPVIGTATGILLSILIDIFALLTFYVWFKIKGVSFRSGKRIASFWSGFVLGWIPFVSTIAWTVDVFLVIATIKAEEVLEKVAPGAAQVLNKAAGAKNTAPAAPPSNIISHDFSRGGSTADVRGPSNNIVESGINPRPQVMQDIVAPREQYKKAA